MLLEGRGCFLHVVCVCIVAGIVLSVKYPFTSRVPYSTAWEAGRVDMRVVLINLPDYLSIKQTKCHLIHPIVHPVALGVQDTLILV